MSSSDIQQYDLVRVTQLRYPPTEYNGWHVNRRPPQIGDVGTVVEILYAPDMPCKYVVEAIDSDGTTVWLDDFDKDELELVNRSH